MFEDNLPLKKEGFSARALDNLSVSELEEYITELESEIERVKADIEKKKDSRDAADAFFK